MTKDSKVKVRETLSRPNRAKTRKPWTCFHCHSGSKQICCLLHFYSLLKTFPCYVNKHSPIRHVHDLSLSLTIGSPYEQICTKRIIQILSAPDFLRHILSFARVSLNQYSYLHRTQFAFLTVIWSIFMLQDHFLRTTYWRNYSDYVSAKTVLACCCRYTVGVDRL